MGRSFPSSGSDQLVINQISAINNIFNGGGVISMHLQPTAGSNRTILKKENTGATAGYSFIASATLQYEFLPLFDTDNGFYSTANGTMSALRYSIYVFDFDTSPGSHPIGLRRDNSIISVNEVSTPNGDYSGDENENLSIGKSLTGSIPFNGLIAEFAMWSVDLSTNSKTSLANGVNPFVVERGNLELYIPMYGNKILTTQIETDYSPNHLAVTVTATTKAKHVNVQLLEEYV